MKRWMQKLISVLMTLTLVMSLCTTAFAVEPGEETTPEQIAELEAAEEEARRKAAEEARRKAAEEEKKQLKIDLNEETNLNKDVEEKDVEEKDVEEKDVEEKDVEEKDVEEKGVEEKDVEEKDVEEKDVEEKDVEEKDVEEKDVEEKDVEEKDVEEKDVEEKDVEEKDVEEKDVEEKDIEEKDVEEKDVEEKDIEEKDVEENTLKVSAFSYAIPSMFLADLEKGKSISLLTAKSSGAKGDSSPTEYIETGKTEITMDGVKLDGTNDDQGSDWNWKSVEGTLSILSHDINELVVKEGDLTIQAAGFNRINSLVSNSVVNIIGTGFLLLDDYDLKDSGVVKLTENTMYEETGVVGSVAVFLKDKDAAEENTYKLINGSIPALLDAAGEEGNPENTFGYEIPSGYHLILPSGTSLIMNSFVSPPMSGAQYEYHSGLDFDPSKIEGSVLENASSLLISSGASLTVEEGASIEMISTNSKVHKDAYGILTPKIEVAEGGKLGINGLLKGFGQVTGEDLDISGIDPSSESVISIVGAKIVGMVLTLQDELHKTPGDPISFDELKEAWKIMYPGYPVDTIEAFIIIVNGKTVEVKEGDIDKVTFPKAEDEWGSLSKNPVTGIGIAASAIAATGNGVIENKWEFPSGGSKVILAAEKPILWRVIVTENPKRGTWTLSVWYGDTQIFDLGVTTVRARFKFDKPDDWDTKNIYVVFIDKDGKSLKAFPATYDTVTGELVFDSSLVGEFVVVQFDYQGELYSKGFYDELAKLDAVKHLVDLHNGKAN